MLSSERVKTILKRFNFQCAVPEDL